MISKDKMDLILDHIVEMYFKGYKLEPLVAAAKEILKEESNERN